MDGGADSIGRDSDDLERSGIDPNDDRAECEIATNHDSEPGEVDGGGWDSHPVLDERVSEGVLRWTMGLALLLGWLQ